jgi:hypothetical protein
MSSTVAVQTRALVILREYEQARAKLQGKAVILTNGIAGTVDKVHLDKLHGLRVSLEGHEGDWPVSTLRLAEEK